MTNILDSASYSYIFLISFFKDYTLPDASSLIEALFFIILALCANFNVDSVSWNDVDAAETAAIMQVLELPPRESFSKKVN